MSIEGEINISITVRGKDIKSIEITSSRPLHITKIFAKKSIQDVSNTMNILYQLCNTAHRFTFLSLLKQNNVIKLSKNETLAYQLLLDLETIKEHCFSIASKWSKDNAIDANVTGVLATIKQINTMLFIDCDSLGIDDKTLASFDDIKELVLLLEQQLQILLIGKGSGDASIFEDIDNFNQWLNISTSNSAIFLRSLKENKLNDLGNVDAVYLPDLVTNEISNMLYNSDFIKHPTHGNKPCETTPYSRQINKPLIQQLTTTNGPGLLSRSVAQLLEIFTLLDKVKNDYIAIKSEDICYQVKYPMQSSNALTQSEAARGKLIHQISIGSDCVDDYQILSPTQWNFHPKGVLYRMIKSLNFENKQDLSDKVKLLVNAIDPCVGYSIEVDYA
jgi:hypothetical protein